MYFIPNENLDPTLNLAMEQYILSGLNLDEEILFFFIDRPSIIVGRHQNTIDEINLDYVKAQDIQVVRRLSGGGSVYHDLGNLCFLSLKTQRYCTIFNLLYKTNEHYRSRLRIRRSFHCHVTGAA